MQHDDFSRSRGHEGRRQEGGIVPGGGMLLGQSNGHPIKTTGLRAATDVGDGLIGAGARDVLLYDGPG